MVIYSLEVKKSQANQVIARSAGTKENYEAYFNNNTQLPYIHTKKGRTIYAKMMKLLYT